MKLRKSFYLIILLIAAFLISGCSGDGVGEVADFFEGYTWEQLVGLLLALVFGLFPGFNLFQWLKNIFGIEDQAAHYMVLGSALVITTVAMYVTGAFDLTGFEFTLGNVLELWGVVYAGSQVAYKRFKRG
jgi:hypothetical protein